MAPPPSTSDRSHWPLAGLFAISIVLHSLCRGLLAAVQPTILPTFYLDQAEYGKRVAAYSVGYGAAAPVMGYLIDRFGFRIVAPIAVIDWWAAGTATAFATTAAGLLTCRALLGIAEAAGVAVWLSSSRRLPRNLQIRPSGPAIQMLVRQEPCGPTGPPRIW